MTKKIILCSGAAGCGKGTLLNSVSNAIAAVAITKGRVPPIWKDASCKTHLYKLVQDFFLVSEERFWEIYNDRAMKEKPLPEFRVNLLFTEYLELEEKYGWDLGLSGEVDLSCRQAMIYISELWMKPKFGADFFGRARMHLIKNSSADTFYDDSSSCFNGDSSELDGLVEHFGEDNILLINILGRGTFNGDSRSYHPKGTIKNTYELWNTGTEQEFLEEGYRVIKEFLDR